MTSSFQSTHPVWGATQWIPCEERLPEFQSTHPVWGATQWIPCEERLPEFQSTHPVWGATKGVTNFATDQQNFNPRTPCGVRHIVKPGALRIVIFQSTHPVWGATVIRELTVWPECHFNPRTPCGVRPEDLGIDPAIPEFQSTHPVWGATVSGNTAVRIYWISIHAPRVGCDRVRVLSLHVDVNFNPRTPCGVRPGGDFGLRFFI